jgi:hypothetical protein
MLNTRGIAVAFALAVSGFASAEVIIADPSAFAAGTDVTAAYEGASFFTADSYDDGTITYEAVLVGDCTGCRPAVDGKRVFTQADGRTRFDYENSFAHSLRDPNAPGSEGKVLLVDFDEQTNFVQIVGSQGNALSDLLVDIWDDGGNWLGSCRNGANAGSCSSQSLSGDELPLWQLTFSSSLSNIGFITVGGSSGPGYVASVSYTVPEPGPLALLVLGLAGLLIARRKNNACNI